MTDEERLLSFAEIVSKEQDFRPVPGSQAIYQKLAEKEFYALAISGGGIRVATFALGILQYLASQKLLSPLHYLSTVSGGGYIGSFLSAWVSRAGSISAVEEKLTPLPPKPGAPNLPKPQEDPAIQWLRQFGKYLAPETSLFSADSWLIGAIWIRNTVLNLLLLVLFLSAVLLLPWCLLGLYKSCCSNLPREVALICAALGTAAAAMGLRCRTEWAEKFGILSALFIVLSSLTHVFGLRHVPPPRFAPILLWPLTTIDFYVGLALGFVTIHTMMSRAVRSVGFWFRMLLGVLLAAYCMPLLDWLIGAASDALRSRQMEFLVPVLVPQIVTLQYALLVTLLIGLAGRLQPDDLREWWSRVGAWMAIFGYGGLGLAAVSVVGPALFFFIQSEWTLALATSSIWTAATGAGVLLGRSSKTGSKDTGGPTLVDRILPLAPVIFMGGFLVLAATTVYFGLFYTLGAHPLIPHGLAPEYCRLNCQDQYIAPSFGALWHSIWTGYIRSVNLLTSPVVPFAGLFSTVALFFLLSRLFDINEFSMHPFYRTRLVRAYLGASRGRKRCADAFTNIDPNDDLPMQSLQPGPNRVGPIHLVNTAANLNLASTGLDERRAASFVFTPWACGYSLPYSNVERYRWYSPKDEKFGLGTPMTISGAAASPNMGYHTSAPVAFLMTLFNVRLGYWMFNTADGVSRVALWLQSMTPDAVGRWFKLKSYQQWSARGPFLGSFYYLFELFGIANSNRKYVYLSDGGHFENMAVYELLRRRARFIICVDGEEDPGMKFEGFGGLVRKARSDMGIEITMDTSSLEERDNEGWSSRHCSAATIRYPEPGAPEGILLYLKLSVTGDEPIDVLHYRKANPSFPHQSTADQFFTESQFESYRALGYHVAESAFRPINLDKHFVSATRIADIFGDLRRFWTGAPRNIAANAGRNTEQLIALLTQLREDPDLWYLNQQFEQRWLVVDPTTHDIPTTNPAYTKGFYFCQQLIQLMENVYVDLGLETNYDHPEFSGWTEQFCRWARSPMFRHTYSISEATFGPLFRNFYLRRIQECAVPTQPRPVVPDRDLTIE
ncbi:MAG TPA: hypothetical protein VFQ91_05820 [Bryobacteraceae bacterium]|nr:hypothetical protein [Bryobacteraceae bacterium]